MCTRSQGFLIVCYPLQYLSSRFLSEDIKKQASVNQVAFESEKFQLIFELKYLSLLCVNELVQYHVSVVQVSGTLYLQCNVSC